MKARFSEILISIFEGEVSSQLMNAHRLSITLTELSLKNSSINIGYKHSEVVKFHIDLINQTFLYPIILSTHAGFESLLQQLCKWIETNFDFKNSLEPYHAYTLKDMGVFFRGKDDKSNWKTNLFDLDLEKDWSILLRYQQLRNLIAHFNGNYHSVPKEKQNQFQNIRQIENLYVGPNGLIILDSQLPEKYIEFLYSFISKLVERVKNF